VSLLRDQSIHQSASAVNAAISEFSTDDQEDRVFMTLKAGEGLRLLALEFKPMRPVADKLIAPPAPIEPDLVCHHYGSKNYPFRTRLHFHALAHLMNDALNSVRVYELMSIRRPGDVWNYVWVEAVEVPPRVEDWVREKTAWGHKSFVTFKKFDGMFR
jgi:hypothetical protein